MWRKFEMIILLYPVLIKPSIQFGKLENLNLSSVLVVIEPFILSTEMKTT